MATNKRKKTTEELYAEYEQAKLAEQQQQKPQTTASLARTYRDDQRLNRSTNALAPAARTSSPATMKKATEAAPKQTTTKTASAQQPKQTAAQEFATQYKKGVNMQAEADKAAEAKKLQAMTPAEQTAYMNAQMNKPETVKAARAAAESNKTTAKTSAAQQPQTNMRTSADVQQDIDQLLKTAPYAADATVSSRAEMQRRAKEDSADPDTGFDPGRSAQYARDAKNPVKAYKGAAQEYAELQKEKEVLAQDERYQSLDGGARAALLQYANAQDTDYMAALQGFFTDSGSVPVEKQVQNADEMQRLQSILKRQYGLSDKEIAIFSERIRQESNQETAQMQAAEMQRFAKKHPVLASAASVPMQLGGNVLGAVGAVGETAKNRAYKKELGADVGVDLNAPTFGLQTASNTIRSQVQADHDWKIGADERGEGGFDAFDFLYSTGMSGADSLIASAIPGGSAILGVGAASQAYTEAINRGVQPDNALLTAIAAGVAESLFEEVSISQLHSMQEVAPKSIKAIAMNLLKATVTNASEEANTEIANIVTDYLINGELSDYALNVAAYEAQGVSHENAVRMAKEDARKQILEAGASGALMGAGFGAVGSATGYTANKAADRATHRGMETFVGEAAIEEGRRREVVTGAKAAEGTEAQKIADKALRKANKKGKAINAQTLGKIDIANRDYMAQNLPQGTQQGVTTQKEAEQRFREAVQNGENVDAAYADYQDAKEKLASGRAAKAESIADIYRKGRETRRAGEKTQKNLDKYDHLQLTNPKLKINGKQTQVDGGNFEQATGSFGAFRGVQSTSVKSIKNTIHQPWNAQIRGFLRNDGTIKRSDTLTLFPRTPSFLLNTGISDHPLAIPVSVLNKAQNGKNADHQVSKNNIMALDRGIEQASAVILHPERNAMSFVTNLYQDGKPVFVTFALDSVFDGDHVHQGTSIHLRSNLAETMQHLPKSATVYIQNKSELNKALGASSTIVEGLDAIVKFTEDEHTTNEGKSQDLNTSAKAGAQTQGKRTIPDTAVNAAALTVKLADGRETTMQGVVDALPAGSLQQQLWNAAAKLHSAEAANLFIEHFDGENSTDLEDYRHAYQTFYLLGRSGMTFENARKAAPDYDAALLSADAQRSILNAGAADRTLRAGVTDMTIRPKSKQAKIEQQILDAAAKQFHLEFIIADDLGQINGEYLTGSNRILLSRNAEGSLLLRTAGHEAYHVVEEWNGDAAAKLKAFVLERLQTNGVNVDEALQKYAQNGYKSRAAQEAELVADSMFDVFSNKNTIRALTQEHRTLGQKLRHTLDQVLASIRSTLRSMGIATFADGRRMKPEISALLDDAEALEQIRTMLTEGLRGAGDAIAAAGAKKDTAGAVGSIKDDFYKKFDAWDGKDADITFTTGRTSNVMKSIGMHDNVIELHSGTILQKLKDHPEMTREIFRKIPELMEDPVIVQFSDAIDPKTGKQKYDTRVTLLGDLTATVDGKEKPVLVSLELLPTSRTGKLRADVSIITSAYAKNALQHYIDENSILYINPDKKRTDRWLLHNRLQLPLGETRYGSIRSIRYSDGKVKVQNSIHMNEMQRKLMQAGAIDEFGDVIPSTKDPVDFIAARTARTMQENLEFRQIFAALGDYYGDSYHVEAQIWKQIALKETAKTVRGLLREYGSNYDAQEATRRLASLYEVMNNYGGEGTADYTGVLEGAYMLAREILQKSSYKNTELYDQFKDVRDYLRGVKLWISPTIKAEIETMYGDYNTYRSAMFGKINSLSTTEQDGRMRMDELWQELNTLAPEYFPLDTNEGDMPGRLAWFFEATAPRIENPYEQGEADINETAAVLQRKMIEGFLDVKAKSTKNVTKRNMLWNAKQQMQKERNQMLSELRAQHQALQDAEADLRAEYREKTRTANKINYERYQQKLAQYRELRENREERRKHKAALERNLRYMKRRLEKETNSDHIPEELKPLISTFSNLFPSENDKLDDWQLRKGFAPEDLRKLADAYRVYTDKYTRTRKSAMDPQVILDTIDLVRTSVESNTTRDQARGRPRVNGTHIRNLQGAEIKALMDISDHLRHLIRTENRLFADEKKRKTKDLASTLIQELTGTGRYSTMQELSNRSGKGDQIRNGINEKLSGFISPSSLFRGYGSDTLYELFRNVRRGENTVAEIVREAQEKEQSVKANYQYDPMWCTREIMIPTSEGETDVSIEDALEIYALSKRPQGRRHLLSGGVKVYTTFELTKNGWKKARQEKDALKAEKREATDPNASQNTENSNKPDKPKKTKVLGHVVHFTEMELYELEQRLTDAQKGYADSMVDYITHEIGQRRNEISMALYGIERYKEKYYIPIHVAGESIDAHYGQRSQPSNIKNQSSSKRTQDHADNPVDIQGFTKSVNEYIYDSALYCAYTLPLEDLHKVLNFRDKELGTPEEGAAGLIPQEISVESALKTAGGVNRWNQITKFLVDVDSGQRNTGLTPFAKFFSNAKRAAVTGNLSVVVQQPSAVARAYNVIDQKYFSGIVKITDAKETIEEMKRWNGCALIKEIGYFDVNMGGSVLDWIDEYKPDKQTRRQRDVGEHLRGIVTFSKDTADQIGGFGAEWADEHTWATIWIAAKKMAAAQTGLKGDAMLKAAADIFQETVAQTQVYDSVFNKCEYLRQKNSITSLSMAFMSEPILSMNMMASAMQSKKPRKIARAFACYLSSLILNTAAKSFVYAIRDDDEDKSLWEKFISAAVQNLITDPLGSIPFGNIVVELLQGYSFERMDMTFFSELGNTYKMAVKMIENGKFDAPKAAERLALLLGSATGTAAKTGIRTGKIIGRLAKDLYDNALSVLKEQGLRAAAQRFRDSWEPTTGAGMKNAIADGLNWLPGVKPKNDYQMMLEAYLDDVDNKTDKEYDRRIQHLKKKPSDSVKSEITKAAKKMYQNEDIKKKQAEDILTHVSGKSLIDARDMIYEWEHPEKEETKLWNGPGYGEYENSVLAYLNQDMDGYDESLNDPQKMTNAIKTLYVNREISYEEAMRAETEVRGVTKKQAKTNLINWLQAATFAGTGPKNESEEDGGDITTPETLKEALQEDIQKGNTEAIQAEYDSLVEEKGEKAAGTAMLKQIKKAYKEQTIDRNTAEAMIQQYQPDKTKADIYEELENADGREKYTRFDEAITTGKDLEKTVKEYQDLGIKNSALKSQITREFKPKVLAGEIDEERVIDAYEALGMSYGEAVKHIHEWYEED